MKPWFYDFLAACYRTFSFFVHPVRVIGRENIPQEGPVILCANHQSMQDPFVLASYTKRKISFMTKKESFDNPILRMVLNGVGAFPVARGENDISAVRTALKVLKDGGVLGIFPEGHRYTDGQMHEAANGISLIALRSGAKVVPAYIEGNFKSFKRLTVHIGSPVSLEEFGRKLDHDTLSAATGKIMGEVKALSGK